MEIITENDYKKFLNKLEQMTAGQKFVSFNKKIIGTQKRIIGVRTNALRKFAGEISKENHTGLFAFGKNDIFEEVLVKGVVVASYKDAVVATEILSELAESFDCWAETDMICVNCQFIKGNEEFVFNYFLNLLKSEKEFVCRFGIVCLMKYFLLKNYIERIFKALDGVVCEKYYVNMAIAWLICECLVKKPQNATENMQKIIKNNHFNSFIINKSIQKACESFRIDNNEKVKLRELKIR